jgi:hypothetical protein
MSESPAVPSREQQLLLKASLFDGPAALQAWNAWRARTDVDTLDRDSQWLLPRLFWNLHRLGVSAEQTSRYRNVYRHHWYRNQLTFREAERAASGASPAEVPGIVVGSAAMALRARHAIGARPCAVVELFVAAGPGGEAGEFERRTSPVQFHTTLFQTDADSRAGLRAEMVAWRNRCWRLLHPVDQFVEICVRRHAWDCRSSLLWIADGMSLIRGEDLFDWTAVDALARSIGQQHAVNDALEVIASIDGHASRRARPRPWAGGPSARAVS